MRPHLVIAECGLGIVGYGLKGHREQVFIDEKSAIRNHQAEIGRRTRGDERINRNNHPIRAGDVIGTHNGTIYNADYLFRRFKLPRFAQVDDIISDFGLEISD